MERWSGCVGMSGFVDDGPAKGHKWRYQLGSTYLNFVSGTRSYFVFKNQTVLTVHMVVNVDTSTDSICINVQKLAFDFIFFISIDV